jgi:Ca2+-transporting ATPase
VSLSVDESLLTGESVSVHKSAGDANGPLGRPGGENTSFVFSGTLVVQGHGAAEVRAIGSQTELGKIGKTLQTLPIEKSSLKKEINRLTSVLATAGLSICGLLAVFYGLTRESWLNGLLVGITMAMSLLPRSFLSCSAFSGSGRLAYFA